MERYRYLQEMPNSPLSPLTPLSENTEFEFNFGGDGSLDEYINSIRQEHRVEQQREKLLQQANETFRNNFHYPLPKRYSDEFLKLRDVFEDPKYKRKQSNNCNKSKWMESPLATPKAPTVKIICSGGNTAEQTAAFDYINTPTNVRTTLKLRKTNVLQNSNDQRQLKLLQPNQVKRLQKKQQHLKSNPFKNFLKASPIAVKPLCPQLANILQQYGLSMYCNIFQREEIDLLAFGLLQRQDLLYLGITNQNHYATLMKCIQYVRLDT